MSHTVLRGEPCLSQLYLDKVLDAVLLEREKNGFSIVRRRDSVSLAEILYYSMRNNANGVYMINGATGESLTYEALLKIAVSIARALIARGLKGKTVFVMTMNHEHMAALYYGLIFAGVVPFFLDANATLYEIKHFLNLVTPSIVFCETNRHDDVLITVKESFSSELDVIIINQAKTMKRFIGDHSDNFDGFGLSIASPESTVLMLGTSGSTGLPKATLCNNQGLIAQLPVLWTYHNRFPRPTELVMLSTTAQWATNTIMMTTCPVYQITILMSPKKLTTDHLLEMFENFRPTYALLPPTIGTYTAEAASPHQLMSLKTVNVTGSPITDKVLEQYKKKLPRNTVLCNGYGATEMQSFIAIADHTTPEKSLGRILNTLLYKIVDDTGKELGPYDQGELWLKSDLCVFKGYYKNEEAYRDSVTSDGWYKTGDVFYKDENEQIYFVFRKKFCFKYSGNHVSPEEIENVISSIPGVQESVVCDSGRGPAAAVVRAAGGDVTRERIHRLVDSSLSDHKRLRGGIVFVETLPRTHTGKLNRSECTKYVQKLLENTKNNYSFAGDTIFIK